MSRSIYLDRMKCHVSLLGVNRLMCMTAVEKFVTCDSWQMAQDVGSCTCFDSKIYFVTCSCL